MNMLIIQKKKNPEEGYQNLTRNFDFSQVRKHQKSVLNIKRFEGKNE